jgi:2-keto-3-deoxy-galactonokinase
MRTWLAVFVIAAWTSISIIHPQMGQAHGGKGSVEVIPGVNTNSISAADVIPGNECAKVGTTKTISGL